MRQAILVVLLFSAGTCICARPHSAGQSTGPSQSGAAPQSPSPASTPAPCPANPDAKDSASTNCPQTPAKPADGTSVSQVKRAKPHKVITNDDIDARPHDITIEGTRDILQQLNTCDRTCFDQVAQRAALNGNSGPGWKLALLDAIEAVKADSTWQGILGEIIGVQGLACETQAKKTQDIQRYADARNITPSELAVEREYEPKFREIRNRLNAALDRANAHIAKSSPGVLQSSYMHLQADKIVHATCTINVPRPPDDTDDPVDP